jgi:sensor histidine kinase YesM
MIAERRIDTGAFLVGFVIIFTMKTTLEMLYPDNLPFAWYPFPFAWYPQHFVFNLFHSLLVNLVMLKGTAWINALLDRRFPWFQAVTKRLLLQLLITCVLSFLVVSIIALIITIFILPNADTTLALSRAIALGTLFSMILSIIYTGVYFFKQWGNSRLEAEREKREKLQLQYSTLKQQLSPHFLFNSLSTLSGLIAENQSQANEFVQKLSDTYRYVLQSIDKNVVELETELRAVEAYIFLHKIRVGENLKINIDVTDECMDHYIAPLTLLILIENALKHNIISDTKPLEVDIIARDKNVVIVKNNIQKKNSIEQSEHIGLQNIINRYRYLDNKSVEVEETASEFIVTVPLLEKNRE